MLKAIAKSYFAHGLVGALLSAPLMFLLFGANIAIINAFNLDSNEFVSQKLIVFWSLTIGLPMVVAELLYFIRQMCLTKRPDWRGVVAYALPAACAGVATLLIVAGGTLGNVWQLLGLYTNTPVMLIALVLVGATVGMLSLFWDKRWHHT